MNRSDQGLSPSERECKECIDLSTNSNLQTAGPQLPKKPLCHPWPINSQSCAFPAPCVRGQATTPFSLGDIRNVNYSTGIKGMLGTGGSWAVPLESRQASASKASRSAQDVGKQPGRRGCSMCSQTGADTLTAATLLPD